MRIAQFRSCAGALGMAILALCCLTAQAADVTRIRNGVVLINDPDAKQVTVWLAVHAGCRDELHAKCQGLAHYVEHLMFLGRSAEHREGQVSFFGDGSGNAYTNSASTVYFQTFPARADKIGDNLEKIFRYFTDHLQHLDVQEGEAARERGIVLQEYNLRVGQSATAKFAFRINEAILPNDPLGYATIGTPAQIQAFTVEAAKAFHQRWYSKSNAAIVVYGPIEPDLVRRLTATYYDPIVPRPVPDRAWLTTLRSYEPYSETIRATDPRVRKTSVSVDILTRFEELNRQQTSAASQILLRYLRGRFDGGLRDQLVEQSGLATDVTSVSVDRLSPGALWSSVTADVAPGIEPDALIAAIDAELARIARDGVPEKTVARLKTRILEERQIAARDPQRVANEIVSTLAVGVPLREYTERDKILSAVSVDDVNLLAQAMAAPGRRVYGVLAPEAGPVPAAPVRAPLPAPQPATPGQEGTGQ